MAMLADLVDVVIGVDTHKHPHTAAVVTAVTGAVVDQATVSATRLATSSCGSWPASNQAGAGERSRAPAATGLA